MLDLTGAKNRKDEPKSAASKDATDASFMADVVEASKTRPVIVDFWAPWCGPCRQLTPAIEKAVAAAKGAVALVKVNIDENPRIAAQLRVQSIPTVYAFVDGQPVDGFQGAVPDSQLKAFVDRLTAVDDAGSDGEALMELAAQSLAVGDVGGAAQAYAQALQIDATNLKAIAGLARCYLAGGDLERAKEVLALAPEPAADAELSAVRSALSLAEASNGDASDLARRAAADPDDHQARLDLALSLAAKGDYKEASDHLLSIIEADRDWNEGAARHKLLTVLEAAGPASDVARAGRRRLSALLFS